MKTPGTFTFVLRWYGPQFVLGTTVIILSFLGLLNFQPVPPNTATQSVPEMLGIWPYIAGLATGIIMVGYTWIRARFFRN